MDRNLDGWISESELNRAKDILEIVHGEELKSQPFLTYNYWGTIMEHLDLDGDDRIDFNEFYAATIDFKSILTQCNID